MRHKFAMNKALEQKLIGPMEESHTKEQSPQAVLRGSLSKEIENGSKTRLDLGLSWLFVFVGGRRSVWVKG